MNIRPASDSGNHISRLRSAARTGSLRAVVGELARLCKETTFAQCSKLARMMPALSVETARITVRTDE